MKAEFKAHPLMIFSFIKPFLFVLVLPLVRAVLQYFLRGEITDVLGLELVIFCIITAIAFVRYRAFKLTVYKNKIKIRKGLFFVAFAEISFDKLSSVQSERNPLDALFGAVTYRVNTEAGTKHRADFRFKLSKRDSERLSALLYREQNLKKVKFSAIKIALMAMTTSSAFTGMIIGVPLINNAGKLLGVGLNEMLFDELNNVSSRFETYFPPIVNLISLVFLLAYSFSFIYSFLKYINFKLYLGKNKLRVCTGFFIKIITDFKKSAVNNVKIEQSPLMLFFRRYSMKASIGGFGTSRKEAQIIVPCGSLNQIQKNFIDYFPFLKPNGNRITACKTPAILDRFLFLPGIFFVFTVVLSIFATIIFEEFTRFILFLCIISLIFILYFAFMCRYEYKYSKLILGDNICVQSVKGLKPCELYCPKEKIGEIKITRFGLDFLQKTCKVRLTVCSESADSIRLRFFDYPKTLKEIYNCFDINV